MKISLDLCSLTPMHMPMRSPMHICTHTQAEPDEGSVEVHQDSYFMLFAALLNLSVLRSARPEIGLKGLRVSERINHPYQCEEYELGSGG